MQWTKNLLGDSSAVGDYVEQTSDGGYLVAGEIGIGLHIRLLLVKTNSNGDAVWTKTLGANIHVPTEAFAAHQTADGGYMVGANGALTDREDRNVWLVKLAGQGKLVWQSELSSDVFPYGDATGRAIVQTSDGGYAVTANSTLSDSALILCKTDSLGNRQWLKRYPIDIEWGTYDMFPLHQTSDGGYIIGTRTLLKVDSCGNQQWLRTFDDVVCANSVLQTPDGGYVATGPASDHSNAYLLKVRVDGSPEWIVPRLAGDTESEGYWLEQAADGGFAVAGSYRGPSDRGVACVFRLTSNGIHVWTDSLCIGAAACVRQTGDGGYIVTGSNHVPPPPLYGIHYLFLTKLAPDREP
ncbi:MAG: hypothetical protein NTX53_13360 [candidate division WOR-3 bacterium]|nr:hypothetical protein [candidate division WOR-3 bacterium]